MADISKITLPSGTTYDIKDATARSQIEALTGGDSVIFIGVSSVELTDGGNQTPKVNGENKTPATGQLFFYGTQEFIYGPDSKWHALGSLDTLGDLAYKNTATGTYNTVNSVEVTTNTTTNKTATVSPAASGSATYTPDGSISGITWAGTSTTSTGKFTPSGSVNFTNSNKTATVSTATINASNPKTYTPAGSVSAPTISVATAGSTTTIKNPTSQTVAKTVVAAAPGATAPANAITYYSVSNETLSLYQLGYTTGDSITTTNITVKDGDASYSASTPTFTGTDVRLVTGNISVPTSASFSGTEDDISVSGVPSGSITNQGTFTGTGVRLVTGNIVVPETYSATITSGTSTVTVS